MKSQSSNSREEPFSETRLDSVENIRREIAAIQRQATAKDSAQEPETLPFRPLHRPPMAMVCVMDDTGDDGEWFRIRTDKTVFGRSEGDIVIPHDGMMSAKHAELSRAPYKGNIRWMLTDLNSTNGTYVRVVDTPLKHHQEILLGRRRFRFNAAPQGADVLAEGSAQAPPDKTKGWKAVDPQELIPSLIEITEEGEGKRFLLTGTDVAIGRSARQCTVALADDPMISPRHCRLFKDPKGVWRLENTGSRNGTWLRVNRIPITTNGHFQLGEQRFFVRILT